MVLPLLMSNWVAELCGASGRASGVFGEDSTVADVSTRFEDAFAEVLILNDLMEGWSNGIRREYEELPRRTNRASM